MKIDLKELISKEEGVFLEGLLFEHEDDECVVDIEKIYKVDEKTGNKLYGIMSIKHKKNNSFFIETKELVAPKYKSIDELYDFGKCYYGYPLAFKDFNDIVEVKIVNFSNLKCSTVIPKKEKFVDLEVLSSFPLKIVGEHANGNFSYSKVGSTSDGYTFEYILSDCDFLIKTGHLRYNYKKVIDNKTICSDMNDVGLIRSYEVNEKMVHQNSNFALTYNNELDVPVCNVYDELLKEVYGSFSYPGMKDIQFLCYENETPTSFLGTIILEDGSKQLFFIKKTHSDCNLFFWAVDNQIYQDIIIDTVTDDLYTLKGIRENETVEIEFSPVTGCITINKDKNMTRKRSKKEPSNN